MIAKSRQSGVDFMWCGQPGFGSLRSGQMLMSVLYRTTDATPLIIIINATVENNSAARFLLFSVHAYTEQIDAMCCCIWAIFVSSSSVCVVHVHLAITSLSLFRKISIWSISTITSYWPQSGVLCRISCGFFFLTSTWNGCFGYYFLGVLRQLW